VTAAKMAVEDFGGKVLGKPIEVVAADHQNKPDIAQLRAFPRHRRRHGQGRLRYLVLPYGRLRLRPRSRAGHGRHGEGGRRPRARQRARSDQHLGFLIRAAPGASLKRPR
jgi:hypothetical protein